MRPISASFNPGSHPTTPPTIRRNLAGAGTHPNLRLGAYSLRLLITRGAHWLWEVLDAGLKR